MLGWKNNCLGLRNIYVEFLIFVKGLLSWKYCLKNWVKTAVAVIKLLSVVVLSGTPETEKVSLFMYSFWDAFTF